MLYNSNIKRHGPTSVFLHFTCNLCILLSHAGETGIWQAESGNIPSDSVAITDTSGVYSQSMDSESVTLKSTASTGNTSNDNPDVQEVSQQLDQLAFEETTESIESETEGIDPG